MHVYVCVHVYMYMYLTVIGVHEMHGRMYLTVIGVHEMHGRMHPNYCQIHIHVHMYTYIHLYSSLAYFMMIQPLPIAGKLSIKTLVARQLPTNLNVRVHTCVRCVCTYVYVYRIFVPAYY